MKRVTAWRLGAVSTTSVLALVACGWLLASAPLGSASPSIPSAASLDVSVGSCAHCHEAVVDNWRHSLHAHAWSDSVFTAEYEAAPAASCRGCHDPAGEAGRDHGIDCATCHVQNGAIVAEKITNDGLAAHPMVQQRSIGDGCAACHQFAFTDDGIHDPNEALQDTFEEWRGSLAAARGETCVDCHLPSGDGRATHRLRGLSNRDLLARAVDVDVHLHPDPQGLRVDVQVIGRRIGHAFPTGDVFRRAVLRLHTDTGEDAELVMQRWLARTADDDGNGSHVRTVEDTRVPPPGRGAYTESVLFSDPNATRVSWALELQRLPLARARERRLPIDDVVVPVLSGQVDVPAGEYKP